MFLFAQKSVATIEPNGSFVDVGPFESLGPLAVRRVCWNQVAPAANHFHTSARVPQNLMRQTVCAHETSLLAFCPKSLYKFSLLRLCSQCVESDVSFTVSHPCRPPPSLRGPCGVLAGHFLQFIKRRNHMQKSPLVSALPGQHQQHEELLRAVCRQWIVPWRL